jgi:hypothetical protein
MNHLLRFTGTHSAELFNDRLLKRMRGGRNDEDHDAPDAGADRAKPDVGRYLLEDDE